MLLTCQAQVTVLPAGVLAFLSTTTKCPEGPQDNESGACVSSPKGRMRGGRAPLQFAATLRCSAPPHTAR